MCNAEARRADPGSILHLYRALLAARRASPALRAGTLRLLDAGDGELAFERVHGDDARRVLVRFDGAAPAAPSGWEVEVDGGAAVLLRSA